MEWQQGGRKYVVLKFANIFALLFWLVYFLDPFWALHNSIEQITDFNEFSTGRRGSWMKKIITPYRSFRTYADENGFFITDTLEIQYTSLFRTVKRYRKISAVDPSGWIENRAWRYRNGPGMFATIALALLTVYLVFWDPRRDVFNMLCLLILFGDFITLVSLGS